MKKTFLTGLLLASSVSFFGQNTFPASGNVGIGTTKPVAKFDVLSNPGQTETLARFHVSDAPGDYFEIENSTSSANQFIPIIKGHHVSDNRYSIQLSGSTTAVNDTGDNALVNFDARGLDGPILTRPLFVWTNYRKKLMTMTSNGDLAIGTNKTNGYKLSVNGKIRASEVKVYTGWADYVFKKDYQLPTLQEVARHIAEKGHLINIPSAAEVAANGIQLGEMNAKLLEKIEELTLYTLEQEKRIKRLEAQQNSSNK